IDAACQGIFPKRDILYCLSLCFNIRGVASGNNSMAALRNGFARQWLVSESNEEANKAAQIRSEVGDMSTANASLKAVTALTRSTADPVTFDRSCNDTPRMIIRPVRIG